MIGKVVTGCVAILSYHTATQDRGSECRDLGFISRIVTALIHIHTQHFTALEDTSMQHVTLHTIQPDRAAGVWCINSPQ